MTRHVTELPAEFAVERADDHCIVGGPSGIFVVGRSEGELNRDAERTTVLAHEVRTLLSACMAWVPFVDPLLVVPAGVLGSVDSSTACTVIEPSMLPAALTTGRGVLDEAQLDRLPDHLARVARELRTGARYLDPA